MVRLGFLSLLLMFTCAAQALTTLTATIDQNPVIANESFVLEIVADDDVDGRELDLSPLLKHFLVGNTSTRQSTQMINFKTTHSTVWTTLLVAKNPGVYTIPAFTLQGVSSQPIQVKVVEAGQAGTQRNNDIYIETSLNAEQVYLQQPVIYTAKLFLGVEITRGSLSEPNIANAQITQLGKDTEAIEVINGRRYRVYTRQYLITPQRSGSFSIDAPSFEGDVVVSSGRRSLFSSMGQSKPVQKFGPSIDIDVRPIPEDYVGNWLPAELITLHDEIQPADEYKVGEPITRTITLTGAGIGKEQLPEISASYPNIVNMYPDQAESHQSFRNNTVIAQRIESQAIIPKQPGELILPEVVIPWFDVKRQLMVYAKIDTKTLTIAPGEFSPATTAGTAQMTAPTPTQEPIVATSPQAPSEATNTDMRLPLTLGTLWLLTLAGWIWHVRQIKRRRPESLQKPQIKMHDDVRIKTLIKTIESGNDKDVANLLVRWAKSQFNTSQIRSLHDIGRFADVSTIQSQLNALDAALYSSTTVEWERQPLAQWVLNIPAERKNNNHDALTPLNP